MTFDDNRRFESIMMPSVIDAIKSKHVLRLADEEKDMKEVSDLMVFRSGDIRIGARVRRPDYIDRYPWDITFRCKLDTGTQTEWSKVMQGWGDLMFYGFANPHWRQFQTVVKWSLISLHAVRRIVQSGHSPGKPIANGDGTHFYAIDIRKWMTFDRKFVIDCNWTP